MIILYYKIVNRICQIGEGAAGRSEVGDGSWKIGARIKEKGKR